MSNINAYFAGLIDGEGHFHLEKRSQGRNGFVPTVEVKMSCHKTILALHETFGGAVAHRKAANPEWKDQWRWRTRSAQARAVVLRIYPYLITKRGDADILLSYWKGRGLL